MCRVLTLAFGLLLRFGVLLMACGRPFGNDVENVDDNRTMASDDVLGAQVPPIEVYTTNNIPTVLMIIM